MERAKLEAIKIRQFSIQAKVRRTFRRVQQEKLSMVSAASNTTTAGNGSTSHTNTMMSVGGTNTAGNTNEKLLLMNLESLFGSSSSSQSQSQTCTATNMMFPDSDTFSNMINTAASSTSVPCSQDASNSNNRPLADVSMHLCYH